MATEQLIGGLHHVGLKVADVDEAVRRWSHILGLHGERLPDGRAMLRCAHEEYALVLRPTGDTPFIDYVCYELVAGVTLEQARQTLAARGVSTSPATVPERALGLVDLRQWAPRPSPL